MDTKGSVPQECRLESVSSRQLNIKTFNLDKCWLMSSSEAVPNKRMKF